MAMQSMIRAMDLLKIQYEHPDSPVRFFNRDPGGLKPGVPARQPFLFETSSAWCATLGRKQAS